MTLQELLTSLGLDEAQMKSVNDAVTALIASKTEELEQKLQPYLDQESTNEIQAIMDEFNVAEEHRDDLRVLSDMDNAEDKKAAVKEALDKRPHMVAEKEDPDAEAKAKEEADKKAAEEEAKKKSVKDPLAEKEKEEETPKDDDEEKSKVSEIQKKALAGNK